MRAGVIAKKLGMTSLFQENGQSLPITLFELDNCQVIEKKEIANSDYAKVKIGAVKIEGSKLKKPQSGYFAKNKLDSKRFVKEFKVAKSEALDPKTDILPDYFSIDTKVDVTGISKGKGFSGGMKRHNFGGLEATHGVSISHRSHGSTGQCQYPGRVFKGKKMAGQYGNVQKTTQNLKVVFVDNDKSLIGIKGSVPGYNGSYVVVRDAIKQKNKKAN